jgi:hypothetical protein
LTDSPAPVPRQRRLLRVAIQIVGFAAGLASLGWCISRAFRVDPSDPVNRFERLLQAPRHLFIAMIALSVATMAVNGLLFWVGLWPVKRLKALDLVATNGVCSFLAYLPLKAGAIVRVLIHNRRDRVPLLTIGAWFASMGVTMAVAFGVPLLAVLLLGPINRAWIVAVVAGEIVGGAVTVGCARAFKGQRGIDRLTAIADALRLKPIRTFLRSGVWAKLHPGFDMIASPGPVAAAIVLRLMDAAVHAGRFLVGAEILGVNLPVSQALPISLTFFVIGVISPAGLAGLREGAATGLAGVLLAKAGATESSYSAIAAVALLVTATEAIAFLASAAAGFAWLRPRTLFGLKRGVPFVGRGGSSPPRT